MLHIFVDPAQMQGDLLHVTGSDVNHIKNVLRMKPGEEIAVSNGLDGKEYRCGIAQLEEDRIVCELRFVKEDGVELSAQVYLFQGLPKADKMEMIIQKCVELGVHAVVPVATKRCVVKLDDKKAKSKISRWQGIAEAAAKQSKRRIVPEILGVMSFKQAIQFVKDFDVRIIPYELADNMERTKEIIGALQPGQRIAVFIGPEGGFDEAEVQEALDNGTEPITLGRRILRTETAGLTVMSWIMYRLEN